MSKDKKRNRGFFLVDMQENSLFIRFSRISRISPNRYNGDNHKIIDHRQHIDQYIVSIGRTYLKYIVMISV